MGFPHPKKNGGTTDLSPRPTAFFESLEGLFFMQRMSV